MSGVYQTELLTDVAKSNLFTMRASNQWVPDAPYLVPPEEVRYLRARLILEEAIETIEGLGFRIETPKIVPGDTPPDLEKIIDGCVDTHYVCVGTILSVGANDLVHTREVCRANDAKFPGGVGVPHPHIKGKFGKPIGWEPPNHRKIIYEVLKARK